MGRGNFKSTDNGETWINTNSGGGFYTALLISDEGYVYAGDDDGLFTYSYDNGNSWNYIPVTNVQINSIATCSNGQIFLGTEGQSIFTSTDYGVTWFQILNPNLSNYVNSIAISDSDYVYATNYDGISISTDYGETWIYQNTLYYTSHDCLAVDSVGNIFLGHTGVYKS